MRKRQQDKNEKDGGESCGKLVGGRKFEVTQDYIQWWSLVLVLFRFRVLLPLSVVAVV